MIRLLKKVNSPADLKNLSDDETRQLAAEIREILVTTISRTGGHLAPNLGVVELTIAIHQALDCPEDKVVWDVGHQSYVHKLLTGRRDVFGTIRQEGGISGFPRREESEYDSFGTGHSSTSISAALGMAAARDIAGDDYTVLAVIGDGALGGGMAFEALNQAGHSDTDLIVVLNDNEMSISRSVGGLASYLGSLRANPKVRQFKFGLQQAVLGIPVIGPVLREIGHAIKKSIKQLLLPGMLFEELGFMYIGPIDGHNVRAVRRAIEDAKRAGGPVLIHVITKKGKGYAPAEANPARFHGTGPFDAATGEPIRKEPASSPASCSSSGEDVIKPDGGAASFTSYFGDYLVRAGRDDSRIVAITAAMTDGAGLARFSKEYPERFFDVGIAEEHAVTFAAGLAASGMRPVAAIYSTFMQRAYDQIVHDVALQKLPVVLAIDRAGIVGEDGYTHQGTFDIAFLRQIPNMVVMAPKDELELCSMLATGFDMAEPVAVRYPKADTWGRPVPYPPPRIKVGEAEIIRDGSDCAVFALGPTVWCALEASRILSTYGVSCAVVNARFAKPIDAEMVLKYAESTDLIVTCEDGCLAGGYGSAVLEVLAESGVSDVQVVRMGIPDRFVEQGRRGDVLASLGLDAVGIAGTILDSLGVGLVASAVGAVKSAGGVGYGGKK